MTKKNYGRKLFGIFMALTMGISCLYGSIGNVISAAADSGEQTTASEDVKISNLEVNGSEKPLGIDAANPVFSWQLSSTARGKAQSAYRIVVKRGNETVWDSQKVASENNYGAVYGGTNALQSKTRYDWTVTVWDEDGAECGSASSYFETGIMQESDWDSYWIGEPSLQTAMNFVGANWIWDREGRDGVAENTIPAETMYFRRSFTVDDLTSVQRVQIAMSADDNATLYLNGSSVLSTPTVADAWMTATVTSLSSAVLQSGENVIAVEATNTSNGYAGYLAKIEIYYTNGAVERIVTDASWKMGTDAESGWNEVSFDDGGWKTPAGNDVISYGSDPWGDRVSFTSSDRAAPMLRKEFATEQGKTVAYARAYIAGLGLYDLEINGKNPADSVLNPANTDYDDTVLYNVYDVTDFISSGQNAVCVELGNGFYNESITGWNWNDAPWRALPKLRFELDVTYTDGTVQHIKSDASWKLSKDGPTTSNSIYSGETFDARKDDDFSLVSYDDSAWQNASVVTAPQGSLVWQDMEPMRKTAFFGTEEGAEDTLTVTYASSIQKYTVAVPRNIAGWSRIVFRNTTAGQTITIDYAETLASDGNLNLKTESDGVTQRDVYICKGGEEEVYEPKFNYKGFQYVQISGYSGTLTADDVTCYVIHNDVAATSSFLSSEEMLNTMHALMTNTLLNNFQGKPTDTPWLEKNGWLGDVNIAIGTMGFDFDIARFMTKFLGDIRDSQTSSGNVPQLVPNSGSANTANAPVWNTVYIFAVEELCDTYGMSWLVDEYYDSMKLLADLDIQTMSGSQWIWNDDYLLGDWSSPVSTPGNGNVAYDEEPAEGGAFAATAYVYRMLGVMAGYAQKLGYTEDVTTYENAQAKILAAFNARYLKNGYYQTTEWAGSHAHDRTTYRQTSNILPLAFVMVPESDKDAVVGNLVKDIVAKDYHLDTGIIGTKYILPVLCDNGYGDVAYRILMQTTYPSWGYWLELGATSLWEMWESTARSHNHYFLGTYDEWFFSYLGGIKDVEDGYRTLTLDPLLVGDLTNVDISVDTVRGTLGMEWKFIEGNKAQFDVIIPFGSTVKLRLPTTTASEVLSDGKTLAVGDGIRAFAVVDGKLEITLGSGTYTFISPLDARENYTGTLADTVAFAEGLSESDYRAEGWNGFQTALTQAKSVLENETVTQEEINQANRQLTDAIGQLQSFVNVNRVALKNLIAEVMDSDVMNLSYTSGALSAFRTALSKANKATLNAQLDETDMEKELADFQEAVTQLLSACKTNLAAVSGATVTASSSVTAENDGWGLGKLTDGVTVGTGGWSSSNLTASQHEEWVQIDFGFAYLFDRMDVYTTAGSGSTIAYGMPRDFVIEVSDDGINFTTVYSAANYPTGESGLHTFSFDPVRARYVRLRGTKLNQLANESNVYRMQLAEIEVYNTARADMSQLNALIAQYEALDRNLYTTDSLLVLEEVIERALALSQETVYETEQQRIDTVVEELSAVLDGLVLKEQPDPVNPPDPVDPEPPLEDEPAKTVDTGAIVGGVIGGVAAVAVIAAVCVILMKRKK